MSNPLYVLSFEGLLDDGTPRYKLMGVLGSGTFGTVLKMEDQKMGKIVAVKQVELSNSKAKKLGITVRDFKTKFMTEKNVMKKCENSHIVKLLDDYVDGMKLFIVMEYCKGGNLNEFITQHDGLDEQVAQRFSAQIADALLYLKKVEISHRDLKPDNILLSKKSGDAVLKITDFGESKFKVYDDSGKTAYKTFAGTGTHMAPEVAVKRGSTLQDTYGSNGNVPLYLCLTLSLYP